jgi:hypothetical protein
LCNDGILLIILSTATRGRVVEVEPNGAWNDPYQWLTPQEVADFWHDVFNDPKSVVTARKMMKDGVFRRQGIGTVNFGRQWRINRDDFIRVMLRNTATVMARLSTLAEERGLDPREAMMGVMGKWTEAELAGAYAALTSAMKARKERRGK